MDWGVPNRGAAAGCCKERDKVPLSEALTTAALTPEAVPVSSVAPFRLLKKLRRTDDRSKFVSPTALASPGTPSTGALILNVGKSTVVVESGSAFFCGFLRSSAFASLSNCFSKTSKSSISLARADCSGVSLVLASSFTIVFVAVISGSG